MTASTGRVIVCGKCGKLLVYAQGQVGGGQVTNFGDQDIIVDSSSHPTRYYLACPVKTCRHKTEVDASELGVKQPGQ